MNLTPAKRKARALQEQFLKFMERVHQQHPTATIEGLRELCWHEALDDKSIRKLNHDFFFYDNFEGLLSELISQDGKAGTA
jgi:hypothetical protein